MGFIVAGKKLHAEHPFFNRPRSGKEEGRKAVFVAESEKDMEEVEDDDGEDVFYDCNDEDRRDDDEVWDDTKIEEDGEHEEEDDGVGM